MLFPQLAGRAVALTVRGADGVERQLIVETQLQSQRAAKLGATAAPTAADAPLWQLEFLQHDIAYLVMPSWVAYQTTWDWRGALEATFTRLGSSPALIIDLRGNEGGSDIGDAIIAHLIDAPVKRRTTVRRVRFTTVPADLRPALDTWDESFFVLGAGPEVVDVGGAGASPRYRGRVVLIDAANSSATFQFVAALQRHALATLVGTPTGGSQRGINGGAFFFARLPATGLEVDVPLIGTFPPGPVEAARSVPDLGIAPDIAVMPTARDIADGRDVQLERAIAEALR